MKKLRLLDSGLTVTTIVGVLGAGHGLLDAGYGLLDAENG